MIKADLLRAGEPSDTAPSSGCSQVSLTEFDNDGNVTTNITGNNTIYTSIAGVPFGVARVYDSVNTFTGNSSTVQLEVEIKAISDPFNSEGAGAFIGDTTGGTLFKQGFSIFPNTGVGASVLLDVDGNVVQGGLTLPSVPFKMHLEVDLSDGSGTYTDSINGPISLPIPTESIGGAGTDTLAIFGSGIPPAGAGETIETDIDATGPFSLGPIDPAAVEYCNAV